MIDSRDCTIIPRHVKKMSIQVVCCWMSGVWRRKVDKAHLGVHKASTPVIVLVPKFEQWFSLCGVFHHRWAHGEKKQNRRQMTRGSNLSVTAAGAASPFPWRHVQTQGSLLKLAFPFPLETHADAGITTRVGVSVSLETREMVLLKPGTSA
ncbi:hypothetical protein NDU88_001470 [Pleurodeles waltl]|uniref:Uncharacterized protein n=1 Tax=Pleurodeles waltl TaxID=8319 RepID=A0AAV7KWD5_PLEWA|nr:hypothetical protein NDU88_001470 [Pleurodeles waltl]